VRKQPSKAKSGLTRSGPPPQGQYAARGRRAAGDGEAVEGLVFGGELGSRVGLEVGAVVAVGEVALVFGELGVLGAGAPRWWA